MRISIDRYPGEGITYTATSIGALFGLATAIVCGIVAVAGFGVGFGLVAAAVVTTTLAGAAMGWCAAHLDFG